MIYQKSYEEIISLSNQITRHRQKLAKPKVSELVQKHIDINVSNEDLLLHIIGESLLKRIDFKLLESKNIYMQQFDIPQIQLFYSMAKAVPFVFAGHSLANQCLVQIINTLKHATLIEIGIGKGVQVVKLLKLLAKQKNGLKNMNIIAIDPNEQNLNEALESTDKLKEDLPFSLFYFPMCNVIENFTQADYNTMKEIGGDTILVNSSFSLHHTIHPINDQETRNSIFRKLSQLSPLLFTLIEPNSDHDTEDLTKRMHNCWQHFGNVYKLIDDSDIDPTHKFTIKSKFFGREINDIFGVSDHFRSERHETYESWMLRFARAGFTPVHFSDLNLDTPAHCDYTISDGLIRMNYNDITIVSLFFYSITNP